jgi:hypothetical protein
VRLSAKTDAAGPAVACFGVQLCEIDEGGHPFILRRDLKNSFAAGSTHGVVETSAKSRLRT